MQNKKIGLKNVLFIIIFLLFSCASPAPVAPTEIATLPVPIETAAALPTEIPAPTNTALPALARAQYILDTTIDYDAHTVSVDETILYPNLTGNQLNILVMAIVPNLWQDSFSLTSIAIDGTPTTTYSISGQRLDISLASILPAGSVIKIDIQYMLSLPFAEQEDPSISRPRIYGYTTRQMNLTNWYPFVVPFINGEWILHEPWFYGEHLVYDAADYEVNLKFTDPTTAPIVAASGLPEQQADSTRYTIISARTFAIAASREFQVSSTQADDIYISSYYFPFFERPGQGALQATVEAVQIYSQVFGPYPHKSLAIVMGDFNDGMEYSAFFYLSKGSYDLYDGTYANLMTALAVHETAHQWWFEQIGNDQALQPWVDETLATYSERIYYEKTHPDILRLWWWYYRIDAYSPQGFIDISIYEGQGFQPYTSATYRQGAHFLEDLRARIGDEAFFAFLQDYLAQGRGRIVTADDFFRILSQHTGTDYSDLVRQYFQNIYQ
ncbi:MAG: M1 family metallopeptidase [Anaerolineales bacterium]|nr:M1 family metallopeptidase [Anaerolineales bacterium]